MKMKSLMMCAISGLLAAAFAYVSPVLADDTNTDAQSMPSTPADQNQSSSSDNNTPTQDNSSNTTTNDQNSTPDTPAGDDDY